MTKEQIEAIQKKIGTTVDGFWGPMSTAACQKHLRDMMPTPHPFPKRSGLEEFYGPHGVKNLTGPRTKKITLPFPIHYGTSVINSLSPHEKCADSLLRVFERLAKWTHEERERAGVHEYDGIYNPRPMRGGSSWSMHSWAIAIDLNASANGNRTHWPTRASMPLEVMECFAAEGWTPAGAFWSRDAMHFEAVQP